MNTYERAIDYFGEERQIIQTCEECSELIQAISKANRYGEKYTDNVAEEIADVLIMIEQIKLIFDITDADIERYKQMKLNRLRVMVKGGFPNEV